MDSEDAPLKPFSNGQRMKRPPLPWSVWVCRNIVLLFIKFVLLYAFFSIHKHHVNVQSSDDGIREFGSLRLGLAEFRRGSRTSNRVQAQTHDGNNTNRTTTPEQLFWSKLNAPPCESKIADPFPESFDPIFYESKYHQDHDHYLSLGRDQGLKCSRGQDLREILTHEILPVLSGNVLEIGPFINPLLRGARVEYFDVANWKGLVRKADELDYIVSPKPIEITHVNEEGDISTLDREGAYSLVVSSHVLTIQTNIVQHLRSVSRLLNSGGGYYVLFVHDKRFGGDHFVQESTIAEVLADLHAARRKMKHRSFVEFAALQSTIDDPLKHWQGIHGRAPSTDSEDQEFLEKLRLSLHPTSSMESLDVNFDVPQYHFTPHALATMIDTLYEMQLIDIRVHQLYETTYGSAEFSIVLRKC